MKKEWLHNLMERANRFLKKGPMPGNVKRRLLGTAVIGAFSGVLILGTASYNHVTRTMVEETNELVMGHDYVEWIRTQIGTATEKSVEEYFSPEREGGAAEASAEGSAGPAKTLAEYVNRNDISGISSMILSEMDRRYEETGEAFSPGQKDQMERLLESELNSSVEGAMTSLIQQNIEHLTEETYHYVAKYVTDNMNDALDRVEKNESEFKNSIAHLTADLDKAEAGFAAELTKTWNEMDVQMTREISEAKSGMEKQLSDTKSGMEKELSETKYGMEKELSGTKEEFSNSLERAKTELDRTVGAAQTEFSNGLSATKTELANDISAAKTAFSDELGAAKTAFSDEIGATKTALSGEIGAAKTAFSDEIGATKTALSGEIGAAKTAFSEELDAAKTAFSNELGSTKTELADLTAAKTELQKGVSDNLQSISNLTSDLGTSNGRITALEQNNAECALSVKAAEEAIVTIHENISSIAADLTDKGTEISGIRSAMTEQENAIEENRTAIAGTDTSIQELKKNFVIAGQEETGGLRIVVGSSEYCAADMADNPEVKAKTLYFITQ